MKKTLIISLAICIFLTIPVNAQVGKFLKNVTNSVKQDLAGKPDNGTSKSRPEPPCACETGDLIFDVGKYKIDYSEVDISVLEDGRVLLRDQVMGSYYVVKNGVTEGPIKADDPRVKQFEKIVKDDDYQNALLTLYKDYITKKGDKYIITFAGKTYGPYAKIDKFAVSKSKEKFAAMVTENIVVTEDEGKKMDEAMKNAKTQEEQMQLAMKYSQQMQQKMISGGGPQSMGSKLISNVPVSSSETVAAMGGNFYSNLKYDDILLVSPDKAIDLQGNKVVSFVNSICRPENMFISTDNSRYACYDYGSITFSDGKKMSELFNPHLVKLDGKVYLAYMYYSPKRNAIMQCKIPF